MQRARVKTMRERFLPYGRQSIDEDDIAEVVRALHSDFLTTGPRVAEFEAAFASATGAQHAVACNSGTAALHLAMLALDLGKGDAAIVPAITFLATANVVRMTGAEVVFADVDPLTGLLTPESLSAACGRAEAAGLRVRSAVPVHLNGRLCDMAGLAAAAAPRGIELVEDACHALGVSGVGANAHSVAACFSTHPVKAVATGEGGLVTTRDVQRAARMRRLRSHGMNHDAAQFENREAAFSGGAPNPWYYEMAEIGWNYRIPDILCALGISQLKKLPGFHARRRAIAARYDALLAPLAPILRPVSPPDVVHGWHLYVVHIDFAAAGTTRAHLMKALREEGIGTQVHYIPLHWQPYYRQRYGRLTLDGAEAYYGRCLSVPCFPSMTEDDVERVALALKHAVG